MHLPKEINGIEIRETEYGIANNYGSYIEINENLKDYPDLLRPVLEHELSHTNKAFSWEDFKLDFIDTTHTNRWQMVKFMFKHPKTFTQLLPIYWTRKKGFVYDLNLMVMYLIMSSIFIITIYMGVNYT